MKAPENLRALFADAVATMRAQNMGDAKKTYHKAMLAIHPDKQTSPATKTLATSLSQKLSELYQNMNQTDSNSNDMPVNHGFDEMHDAYTMIYTPGDYGARYRPQRTYDASDRTRQRHPGDPVADNLYKHAHATNPILFKRHVISKIPKEYRPCPPGHGDRATHAPCQRRIKPMVGMAIAARQYATFGDDLYWVGTEHGRRAIAHAIAKLVPNADLRKRLKAKAISLGFDVDGEMRRKRSTA